MLVAPSILNCNFKKLEEELNSLNNIDYYHIDIMDGNFVPNISFGPEITAHVSEVSKVPLDIHLMVKDPLMWIDDFTFANTEYITVHYESNNFEESLSKIKENGVKTGISIKPNTNVDVILPYLKEVDLVLVMTVEPGFGGQSFMEGMMLKTKELANYRKENNLDFIIEVDGGINGDNIKVCKENGVDMVVAGSYIFKNKDRNKAVLSLKV